MFLLIAVACVPPEQSARGPFGPTRETGDPTAPACPSFAQGTSTGDVSVAALTEASGLIVAEDVLFTHNDSGAAQLFALNQDGSLRAMIPLEGAGLVVDWEDLGRLDDRLIIGDIGDNQAGRSTVALIEVPIPSPLVDGVPVTARVVTAAWPTGSKDAEALLVDPISKDILIASKSFDGITVIGRARTPLPDAVVLDEVARLQFGTEPLGIATLVTGGAIAPDGTGVMLRTYLDAFVWPREPGEAWADTFARTPCPVDLQTEPQGEAIAWGTDGLWTISEGSNPTLWFYPIM